MKKERNKQRGKRVRYRRRGKNERKKRKERRRREKEEQNSAPLKCLVWLRETDAVFFSVIMRRELLVN